jgi:hypothetical protein
MVDPVVDVFECMDASIGAAGGLEKRVVFRPIIEKIEDRGDLTF